MGKPGACISLLYTGCVNQWSNQLLFISHNTVRYRLVFEVDQTEEIMVLINGGLNKLLNNRLFSWDVCKSIKYSINLNQPIF